MKENSKDRWREKSGGRELQGRKKGEGDGRGSSTRISQCGGKKGKRRTNCEASGRLGDVWDDAEIKDSKLRHLLTKKRRK